MRKNNRNEMLNGAGFDWTSGPHRLVTIRNYESFLLMLVRAGAEDVILGPVDPSRTTSFWMEEGRRIDATDLVWAQNGMRIRIRIEMLNGGDPYRAHLEIEKGGTGIRNRYRCINPELVTRILREYTDKRAIRKVALLESRIAELANELSRVRKEARLAKDLAKFQTKETLGALAE